MNRSLNQALQIILACAALLVGCKSKWEQPHDFKPPAAEPAKVEPASCGAISKLHVAGDIYLGSQPSVQDFALLKERGIKTVINLRLPAESELDEASLLNQLGIAYIYIPWSGADQLTDDILGKMRAALRQAERPLLLHCASANRVGAGWLAYRVLDEGVPTDQAVAEAKQIGLKTPAYETITLDYILRQRSRQTP